MACMNHHDHVMSQLDHHVSRSCQPGITNLEKKTKLFVFTQTLRWNVLKLKTKNVEATVTTNEREKIARIKFEQLKISCYKALVSNE